MKTIDSLRTEDQVRVTIFNAEGERVSQYTNSGFRSIEVAIKAALSQDDSGVNPEDCVYEVTNLTTDVSHRYRLNAHGNLKLIV